MSDFYEVVLRKDGSEYFSFKIYPASCNYEIDKNFDDLLHVVDCMEAVKYEKARYVRS